MVPTAATIRSWTRERAGVAVFLGVGGRVSEGWMGRQSGGREEERSVLGSAAALGSLLAN